MAEQLLYSIVRLRFQNGRYISYWLYSIVMLIPQNSHSKE